ncbi:hypothetical protein MUCCIDRAFT_104303 [Mucor lusitanicus CBS 277.49]|uniref:Reverse transcriptase/retrotransposon-derived protein RNase H-like domain-containing protein n=1 Tax=Mucor lusitanicus CBS 277.49 TaxID=747725 RepID=A0A168P9E7_MUCCL|nr:hypothetical protein MUCCIDRAFT_104303 [Mucor lusitanicus CBS 277.49]
MLSNLRLFLQRMWEEVSLKLNSDKCEFLKNEVEVLGFAVSATGVVSPALSKIKKIQDFPGPLNTTGIRAFVNYIPTAQDKFCLYTDVSEIGIGATF